MHGFIACWLDASARVVKGTKYRKLFSIVTVIHGCFLLVDLDSLAVTTNHIALQMLAGK